MEIVEVEEKMNGGGVDSGAGREELTTTSVRNEMKNGQIRVECE